jgi:hypothetical protein
MLEVGDLVLFSYQGNTSDNLIGLVVGESDSLAPYDAKEIYWMEKDRVSPVKVEYLELLNEIEEK